MDRDWFVVKLAALTYGLIWALAAIPLVIWGAATPFIGAGIAFVIAMIASISVTVLDP